MANFNTHLAVASIASGMLATLCLQVGFINGKDALLLAATGIVGGILPDIDLQYSYPSRILFTILGIISAFLWIFAAENQLSIVQLWGAGLGIYLFIRYPIWTGFQKLTVHRGVIHSIGAAILVSLATAILSFHLFGRTPFLSWFIGMFLFLGFILHLILDEIYSVDFMGYRLKRSFGSAFKILDNDERIASGVIIVAIIICWFYIPDYHSFLDTITSPETYHVIAERFI